MTRSELRLQQHRAGAPTGPGAAATTDSGNGLSSLPGEILRSPFAGLCAAGGLAAGIGVLRLGEMPGRWVAAALIGVLLIPALLVAGRPRRAALFVCAFSLQIGLVLYLTKPLPASPEGASWPNSLALPIGLLTAIPALLLSVRRPFAWGGAAAIGTAMLALTTLVSLLDSPQRLIGLCHLVLLLAYYLILLAAANAVRDASDLVLVRRALMASLGFECAVYFAQTLAGATFTASGEWIERSEDALGRYGGLVGTPPSAFATFLLPLLLLAAADFLIARPPRAKWRSGALAAAGLAALILTFTRAAWIAFALGFGYLVVAAMRRGVLSRRTMLLLAAAGVAVVAVLAPEIWLRASQDHAAALDERWALIQMALPVIRANPLTGAGAGAYPFVFQNYLTPDLSERWLYVVHNAYLLRAAETGLPGLAALLVFLWASFRLATPERMPTAAARSMALGWRAGLIALSWEMLWDVSPGPAASSLLWFMTGLMVAARVERAGSERARVE